MVCGDDVESEPPQQWIGHIVGYDGKQAEAFVRHGKVLSSVVSAACPVHWSRRPTRSTLNLYRKVKSSVPLGFLRAKPCGTEGDA